MKKLKIAIIGAGSTYTPELMEGIINKKDSLPVRKLYLMDIDERKLSIVGGLCQRMVEHAGLDLEVVLTMNLDEALEGASFVCAQIRVGKLPARVLDEKIPLKYGLIGQETNGVGGFFKGMRTIPEIMKIVHKMEEICPDAWLINFSNPSGMIAEAVLNNSKIKMMGLCNVPINTIDRHLDLERFNSLGVIDSVKTRPKDELELFLAELNTILQKETTTKEEIVSVLKSYLPNFNHEEKGKNLDQKM